MTCNPERASYTSRQVTCVDAPPTSTYNKRSVVCTAPKASYTSVAVNCVDPQPQATFDYQTVTCTAGVQTTSGSGTTTSAGTCAAITEACGGSISDPYICGASETRTCQDITSCTNGVGSDNDTYTVSGPTVITGTCAANAPADTCPGADKLAAYSCTAGVRTCTDIVCTNTAAGTDTVTVDPGSPFTVTGTCAANVEADTAPGGDKTATYNTCAANDEATYNDIYSCVTTPAAVGTGDIYGTPVVNDNIFGSCALDVPADTCPGNNKGAAYTCPETGVVATCRDINCTDTDPGLDTVSVDASNPYDIVGDCSAISVASPCDADTRGQYNTDLCNSAARRKAPTSTCTDVYGCTAYNSGVPGRDTYLPGVTETKTSTCGVCVKNPTGTCADGVPPTCTSVTCAADTVPDTCPGNDKAVEYTCDASDNTTCVDVDCAPGSNVYYAKYGDSAVTCYSVVGEDCSAVAGASGVAYVCPDSTRKTCTDVYIDPGVSAAFRTVECGTWNATTKRCVY